MLRSQGIHLKKYTLMLKAETHNMQCEVKKIENVITVVFNKIIFVNEIQKYILLGTCYINLEKYFVLKKTKVHHIYLSI